MKIPRTAAVVLVLALIAVVSVVASCSNNSNTGGVLVPPGKELDSGNIAGGGGVYAHTFHTAGTYAYHCTIHGTGMAGSVIVVPGAAVSQPVAIGNNFYNPASVSVDTGGIVTWTNGGVTHTVTSN